ncbi:hypothetical protein CSE_04660 [Caldisericum exile AZM16c01]|uniref:Uncharacterized protein n=1 Tax=Caldisericum exile (strain DSM 21853 / NBRC 104410 / AZM16c01) TaxID=511051 RepID=A0A7U6GE18_CALEA|nr:hypothetical protein CSE_04660 [Caldisericum exile AZM16c01]
MSFKKGFFPLSFRSEGLSLQTQFSPFKIIRLQENIKNNFRNITLNSYYFLNF